MDNIEHLYKCYEILSEAGEKIGDHQAEYNDILKAVKGTSKEKRLASQFIGKFFKHFPDLTDAAIDAQLDLCEDDDVQIRRQAIKDLPKLCQESVGITLRIADTLAQLLALEDPLDLQNVIAALQTCFKIDGKGALQGVFTQISVGDKITRERCFKFIASKLFAMGSTVVTKELEESLLEATKKALKDVSTEEFQLCMNILGSTKLGSTITGHVELVNIAAEHAQLQADVDAITIEDEIVERLIQSATHAMPYFSNQIKSTAFVTYVCEKLLPLATWNMIATAVQQDQFQLRLLKVFAEMFPYSDIGENASAWIDTVYIILKEYLPLPAISDDDLGIQPSFQFAHIECLLYVLHTMGKKNADGLTFDEVKLKDFRSRLQYLARGTQGHSKKLEESVKGKTPEELKSDEHQARVIALKTTSNISALIRDLFHTPPSFKTQIQLSWVISKNAKLGAKRRAAIVFDGETKKGTPEKKAGLSPDKKDNELSAKRHAPITFDGETEKESPNKKARLSLEVGAKRHAPITFDDGNAKESPEKKARLSLDQKEPEVGKKRHAPITFDLKNDDDNKKPRLSTTPKVQQKNKKGKKRPHPNVGQKALQSGHNPKGQHQNHGKNKKALQSGHNQSKGQHQNHGKNKKHKPTGGRGGYKIYKYRGGY